MFKRLLRKNRVLKFSLSQTYMFLNKGNRCETTVVNLDFVNSEKKGDCRNQLSIVNSVKLDSINFMQIRFLVIIINPLVEFFI